ncbi:hypothetical protein EPA93_22745 [Ktedonosporobacter rubrisoli]|uniref:Uncharacterized protein n=1 Tax=Ktedonosporobacter rubrisoli TaxID=2509675 RepID=A0A4P6JTL0_KTERU|nr:hypothetical protein [Ktedonosporobacter rubrisoli]QBD78653.1 hypothetical protein EPA93_22745 [Ktedonosporobacter rubrisoli]
MPKAQDTAQTELLTPKQKAFALIRRKPPLPIMAKNVSDSLPVQSTELARPASLDQDSQPFLPESSWVKAFTPQAIERTFRRRWRQVGGLLLGLTILLLFQFHPFFGHLGLQALGPLLGIAVVVCSLFGELPPWLSWTQRLGSWLFPGILLGTLLLLLSGVFLHPTPESPFLAFSPLVWAAYISIVLVSLSFEVSPLPDLLSLFCQRLPLKAAVLIPLYICIAGLLGNFFDGVSIMAISVVIFLAFVERIWAIRASFTLLFGGLISNLITVAAEPTNIKFQDVLAPVLARSPSPFWLANLPISLCGILLPALCLAVWMQIAHVPWRQRQPEPLALGLPFSSPRSRLEVLMALLAMGLLAGGILVHAILGALSSGQALSLWLLLLPAGLTALLHLLLFQHLPHVKEHLGEQWPIWLKLALIFSLLWVIQYGLTQPINLLSAFFCWPQALQYALMIVLALCSAVTDNVAIAAMLGALLLSQPLPFWQIRLLLILFTWSGGLTPFGCLQSLALNARLHLSLGAWMRQAILWATIALLGGGLGLLATLIW